MNLRVIQIGKTKDNWLKQGIEEYLKRLQPFCKLQIVEIPDVSISQTGNIPDVKSKEADNCLKRLSPDDHVVLLDEHGEAKTSLEFSSFLTKLSDMKSVVFIIGGVYGTDERLQERANVRISLSAMTFTHQFVRLILLEQLYRAFMIQSNRAYHY